jgi:hypothetical protein
MQSTRPCLYCGNHYRPDPRTAAIQKACGRESCRKARRRQAQTRYVAANPDVFEGRYPKTRVWLAERPGYLRRYRKKHPDYVNADHRARVERRRGDRRRKSDIQDAIRRRRIEDIRRLRGSDIQDTIRRQLDGVLGLLTPAGGADIQDAIAPAGAFG